MMYNELRAMCDILKNQIPILLDGESYNAVTVFHLIISLGPFFFCLNIMTNISMIIVMNVLVG